MLGAGRGVPAVGAAASDFATALTRTVGMLLFAQMLEWYPDLPWWVAAAAALCFGAWPAR